MPPSNPRMGCKGRNSQIGLMFFSFNICFAVACSSINAQQLASFNLSVSDFTLSPTGNIVYAAVPGSNQIAVFNATTLSEVETIPLAAGANPQRMTVSPDGSDLYVTEPGLKNVTAINTSTGQVDHTFSFAYPPIDVAFTGTDRLFVLYGPNSGGASSLTAISATTGAIDGANGALPNGGLLYGGYLAASPDRNTLFYGNTGITACGLYKFGIASNGTLIYQATFSYPDSAYGPVTVSHNGLLVNFPVLIDHAQLSSATLVQTGTFNVPFPENQNIYYSPLAFSADDSMTFNSEYTSQNGYTTSGINEFSNSTSALIGTISIPSAAIATNLIADGTKAHLWAAENNGTLVVYAVPEPSTLSLLTVGLLLRAGRSRSRGRMIVINCR